MQGPGELVQLELEAGRDPEVRAGATQPPEQVGLLVRRCRDDAPVGRHQFDRAEAIDGQSEVALEAADSATERQPGHARVTDDPHRTYQAVLLCRDVQLTEEGAATGPCPAPMGVDGYCVQAAQVDDQTALARRVAERTVPAAADSDLELVLATEPDRGNDVIDAGRPHDQRWSPVEDRVPDPSCVVVVNGVRLDDLAGEMAAELIGLRARGRDGHGTRVGAGSVRVSSRVFGRAMTAEASPSTSAVVGHRRDAEMDLFPDEGLVVVAGQPLPLLLAIGDARLVVIGGQAMALLCSRHRCAPFGSWRFPRTHRMTGGRRCHRSNDGWAPRFATDGRPRRHGCRSPATPRSAMPQ